jgi:hypothetical protein
MSDIRKRMAHVKAALHYTSSTPKWVRRNMEKIHEMLGKGPLPPDFFRVSGIGVSGDHYEALKRAKGYFGLNEKNDPTNEFVALAMALVLFGEHGKGRAKGTKTWTADKYLDLADAFWELKKKNEALSDTEICRRLGKGGDLKSDFKDYEPDHLRTLLPEARRAVREYYEDLEAEARKGRRKEKEAGKLARIKRPTTLL